MSVPSALPALVARYGAEHVLEAIDRGPQEAFASVGLRRERAEEAAGSWDALRVTRQLHLMLAPHGLAYLVRRIHSDYGSGAHRIVSERPYELTSVLVSASSSPTGSRTASGRGQEAERSRAGVLHVLGEAERSGSTCLPLGMVLSELSALLGPGSAAAVGEPLIDRMVDSGDLERSGEWVYRAVTAALEAELAQRVGELVSSEPGGRLTMPDEIAIDSGPSSPRSSRRACEELSPTASR